MKVKELIKRLEKAGGELEIVIELFSCRVDLDAEDMCIMDEKELINSIDDGAFISSPYTSDHA